MNILLELQNWYQSQCNDNWEHSFGIEIGTLDNPGWHIEIDLAETCLASKFFEEITTNISDNDWVFCKVEDKKFEGCGDPQKLEILLRIFLDWTKN